MLYLTALYMVLMPRLAREDNKMKQKEKRVYMVLD